MSAPRLEVDLEAVRHNARHLVQVLAARGIRVTGVTKAVPGWTAVALAVLEAGAAGLGDSRIENLSTLRRDGLTCPTTLIRSPMLSQVEAVIRNADVSLNSELTVIEALSDAAVHHGVDHGVVVMVELGDLREGVAVDDVVAVARRVASLPGLALSGIGTNLACQSGVVPDQTKMDELSALADDVERACGTPLGIVSGGNSASLGWALTTGDTGRVDELRLGESVLLGLDPLDRSPIAGLRLDGFTVVAEVIEVKTKPARAWGSRGQTAFGLAAPGTGAGTGTERRALLAIGHQDVEPDGLTAPEGTTVRGASSDHLVVDVGDLDVAVGDEMRFTPDYRALLRAATSPFVARVETSSSHHSPRPAVPER